MTRTYSNKHGNKTIKRQSHHSGNWRKRVQRKRTRLAIKVILHNLARSHS